MVNTRMTTFIGKIVISNELATTFFIFANTAGALIFKNYYNLLIYS